MEKNSFKNYLSSAVFICIISILLLLNILIPPPDMLTAERRVPGNFPELNIKGVHANDFSEKFENWAADSFVFREVFRSIYSFFIFDIYRQNDKSGLFLDREAGLGKINKIDYTQLEEISLKIHRAADYLDTYDMNLYYSIIPDKSEYAGRYLPGFSVYMAQEALSDMLTAFSYIPITKNLEADSYYKTDLHWDQNKIAGTAFSLLSGMNAGDYSTIFETLNAGYFKGLYAGEYALPVDEDVLTYADIRNLKVSYLNSGTMEIAEGNLYDIDMITSIDPYSFFLRGPQPLIIIENYNAPERELYMFRDSFGSSLAPLLTGAYSKITLIDLRYIHMNMVGRYVEFKPGSDVLFIYSTQILGNPDALQS